MTFPETKVTCVGSNKSTSGNNSGSYYPPWKPSLRPCTKTLEVHPPQHSTDARGNKMEPKARTAPAGAGPMSWKPRATSYGGSDGGWQQDSPSSSKQSTETSGSDAENTYPCAFEVVCDAEFPQLIQPVLQEQPCHSMAQEHPCLLLVDRADEDACTEAFLAWMNDDSDQMHHSSRLRPKLISSIASTISITKCSREELPGMRSPWGDRACQVDAVAMWSVKSSSFCWKSEKWWMGRRTQNCHEENMLICSTLLPDEHNIVQQYLLVCSFSWATAIVTDQQSNGYSPQDQSYYVISCPPHVLPLSFAAVASTCGELPWKLDPRQVLPLPPQN